ncbi:hypothetical protein HOG98_08790 [bacterium]|nr:hypothetical protein [bacterium]
MLNYKDITKSQSSDSGLALIFICLLASTLFCRTNEIVKENTAIAATLLVFALMIRPSLFKPFAFIWLNFSLVLGAIMSKVILTIVFYSILCPMGFFLKLVKKDPLKIKQFKSSTASVFTNKNHSFTPTDLKHPF